MENKVDYIQYHLKSAELKDIDPANDCLVYISDRFELNMEQRYWLAFLYSTCYCSATVYYIYNEFPDFEYVDVPRLQRWWNHNKSKCLFQTDRLRIKSSNLFVPSFESYKKFIGGMTQQQKFNQITNSCLKQYAWQVAEKQVTSIANIGRFTSFIYLEMLSVLTDFKVQPKTIDWNHAEACKEGLLYALGYNHLNNQLLDEFLWRYQKQLINSGCKASSVFNIETTLCAYKKYIEGKRYVGYYIDRQLKEIDSMSNAVRSGVNWKPLYDFRLSNYKFISR